MPNPLGSHSFPWQAQGVEVELVSLWKIELTAHGLAFGLVAGQGEELFHAGSREIDLVIETDLDQAPVTKFLAEVPLFRIALAGQLQELTAEHEAHRGDIMLFVDLDAIVAVAAGLTTFAAADFKILNEFWINGSGRGCGSRCFHFFAFIVLSLLLAS